MLPCFCRFFFFYSFNLSSLIAVGAAGISVVIKTKFVHYLSMQNPMSPSYDQACGLAALSLFAVVVILVAVFIGV